MKKSLPLSDSVKRMLPWLVAVAFFMEALDTTILNTAVPSMARALGVQPLSMKSVLSSYTLSVAVFIPLSSWMADRYGTRRVFFSAIALFTLGSMLCGLAENVSWLVFCRILQGCGGAMMVPVGRLTLVRAIDKADLIRAMSFVSIPTLVGPMLGPVAGGFLVTYLSWRMIFFVNLPIGALGLYLVHRHLPDYRTPRVAPLDGVGLILFGSGVALLSYVLEVFGEHSLSILEVSGLLGLSLVLLAGYGLHARGLAKPLLDLGLFRLRTFRCSTAGNLVTRIGAGGLPFLLPLLYQVGLGYSPLSSGLLMLPQSLAAFIFKMSMLPILRRFGYRRVLLANTFFIGLSIAGFSLIGPGAPLAAIILLSAAFGYCSSLQFTSMNTLVYADVVPARTGMASTMLSSVQQMAISFGVAGGSLLAALFIPDRAHADAPQLLRGLHLAFLCLGAWTVFSAGIFWELKEEDGQGLSQHPQQISGQRQPAPGA
jgi:EmrB/QacA subfamily drug resistance transporter